MYKYLLFDADNTLLDFNESEKQALREALDKCPLSFSDYVCERYHAINAAEWKRLEKGETTRERLRVERFEKLFSEFGYDGKEFGEKTADVYMERLCTKSYLIDGALEVLKALSDKYDCYIITNGTASVQRPRLAKTKLGELVKHVFISEDIGYSKPDKAFFDKVFEYIGDYDMSSYLVIGDSLTSDIMGAAGVGVDSVWLSDGSESDLPTYSIESIEKLFKILE